MIIGLAGKRRHGKDSAGAFLVAQGFKRYAFADRLREVLYQTNPVIGVKGGKVIHLQNAVDRWGWEKVKQSPEVIRLQQRLGTEGGRNIIGPNVWIMALEKQLEEEQPENVVITDVRFWNEANWVRNLDNSYVVNIVRPGFEEYEGMDHISETALDDYPHFHAIIMNDGPLELLKEKIEFVTRVTRDGMWLGNQGKVV